MDTKRWRYYNHSVIPNIGPHEEVNTKPLKDGTIWKMFGNDIPLFARWTTNFDCGYETSWWFIIKDNPLNLSTLKAKRRYEINKGNRNFKVSKICPQKYIDEIIEVQIAAYETYHRKYRPVIDRSNMERSIILWNYTTYGAFDSSNKLCAYINLRKFDSYVDIVNLKSRPESEKDGVNAAIVFKVLVDLEKYLEEHYISNGERNISHETNFNEYLEKYFGFRKAYCHLNVKYRLIIKLLVKMIYPFRKVLRRFDEFRVIHQLNGVLFMEEILLNKGKLYE